VPEESRPKVKGGSTEVIVGRTSKSCPRVCTWKIGLILCADPGGNKLGHC
jgi:hypothetical protein